MSVIDDIRKVLQDFIAPELSAIKEKLDGQDKVADARYQSAQSQYSAMQTNMELINRQIQDTRSSVRLIVAQLDAVLAVMKEAATQ